MTQNENSIDQHRVAVRRGATLYVIAEIAYAKLTDVAEDGMDGLIQTTVEHIERRLHRQPKQDEAVII